MPHLHLSILSPFSPLSYISVTRSSVFSHRSPMTATEHSSVLVIDFPGGPGLLIEADPGAKHHRVRASVIVELQLALHIVVYARGQQRSGRGLDGGVIEGAWGPFASVGLAQLLELSVCGDVVNTDLTCHRQLVHH